MPQITINAQAIASTPSAEIEPALGYKFACNNGFTFYEKQCDILCWVGRKENFRTIAYPELQNAVEGALKRLKKEGIDGAQELLTLVKEAKKAKVQADSEQELAQTELEAHIEQQAQDLAPEFEIDSDEDEDFGTLYRIWKSWQLIGTFYQDLDNRWVAQPVGHEITQRFETDQNAILVIIAVTGNLVAA